MAPRLVVSVCLALFLTFACGAALGFAAPPQPLTGNPADRLERMGEYSACFSAAGKPHDGVSTTLAHRDHIHLGLSRAGAVKRTSFWR